MAGFFDSLSNIGGQGWLGAGQLGLGIGGDIFGAYSQMQAQQRQRDLYNQYQQQQQRMQNPAYMIGQATPYYNASVANFQKALPQWMRQNVNPMLGSQGIDPTGGLGQSIYANALGNQQQNMWTNAMNQATGQQQTALNAMGGQTQNVGQPTGQMGGTAGALQGLMLMQALQRYNPQQTTGFDTSGLGGDQSADFSKMNFFGGGSNSRPTPAAQDYSRTDLSSY